MVNTKVTLCGIEMDNPIIPASGTFGFGYEFAELYDINMLGTFSFKGTTREPRFGNPTPRIAEYAGGLLNAVGLQNPGVDAVIETELPKLKQVFHKPVMANISGFSVAEYAEVCEKLDAQEQVGWLEVNISCPNVHGGGAAFGAYPKSAAEVTKAVRAVTKKPIILKLSPTAANIAAVAKACEDEGADGVSLINTMPGMRIDLKRRRPLLCFQQDSLCVMQVVKSVYFCDVHCIWVEKRVELPLMARHVKGIGARLSICNQTVSQARCRFCF